MGSWGEGEEICKRSSTKNIEAPKGLYNMHTVTHLHSVVPFAYVHVCNVIKFSNWILVSYHIPFYAHKAGRHLQRLTLHGYWREVLLSAKCRHANTKVLETPPSFSALKSISNPFIFTEMTSWLGLKTKLSPHIPQTRWIGVPTIRCPAVITLKLSLSITQSIHSYYQNDAIDSAVDLYTISLLYQTM